MSKLLSRLMGAFVGEGSVGEKLAAIRLATCRSNRCGEFNARKETCKVCGCHMPTKVTYARVKKRGGRLETVACPKGLW